MIVTPAGGRVLGCLVEKQLTTPQQYPLTANALALACNQSTNRDPVVDLDDAAVLEALDALRADRLLRVVLPSHGRSVKRYRHVLDDVYGLDEARLALLATLLLRGPQTPGELRARTERMSAFESVEDVQAELEALAAHPEGLVRLVPRRPGQKEERWQSLLAAPWDGDVAEGGGPGPEPESGPVSDAPADGTPTGAVPAPGPVPGAGPREGAPPAGAGDGGAPGLDGRGGRLGALERDLASLGEEVVALHAALDGLAASVDDLRRSLGG